MTTEHVPTRRQVLTWVGVTTALAACSSKAPLAVPTSPTPVAPSTPATSSLTALSSKLRTPLLRTTSNGYTAKAQLYNPRFDATAHPIAIASCTSPADVASCVRYSAESGTPLHLRSGGHSYGGWSTGTGLVVDTSAMSSVAVDRAARTVRIGAGAKLAQVYEQLGRNGVAIAAGSCPTVGITGLALGGGVGVLTRAFGLTCDAIRSVELVTADGRVREVDGSHDPELFWALRGAGGGSFGAVTALTLQIRPAPTVATFFLSWDSVDGQEVLAAWQTWTAAVDRRLWSTCKLLASASPHRVRVVVAGSWIGSASSLDAQLAPLLSAVGSKPVSSSRSTLGYAAAMLLEAGCPGDTAQECLTFALSPGQRLPFAASSAILTAPLPAAGLAAALAGATAGLDVPDLVAGGLSFDALGGAVADVPTAATPFFHRKALATIQYTATWSGTRSAAPFDAYVQRLRSALLPWTGDAAYANYADPAIKDYGTAYWGANYPRLQSIKKQYDPGSLFTFPQAVLLA